MAVTEIFPVAYVTALGHSMPPV